MKRLKLNIDDLRVESFKATDAPTAERGTVHGHGKAGVATYACTVGWDTCYTQEESCAGTCIDPGDTCTPFSQCVGWCESQHDSCGCY
jgi:hypothetical protein